MLGGEISKLDKEIVGKFLIRAAFHERDFQVQDLQGGGISPPTPRHGRGALLREMAQHPHLAHGMKRLVGHK
jgi:hypothetical protein